MKKIIICCDGTWVNSDGGEKEVPSNVTRICRALKSEDRDGNSQIVYYQAGVGTNGSYIQNMFGGGTGFGLSENVREAYGFLAHNYHPGDSIHLFGFSRGAYTARSICGLICSLGVLTKRGMDDFYDVYKDYTDKKLKDPSYVQKLLDKPDGPHVVPNVQVESIGCWDTVGSLGIPVLSIPVVGKFVSGVNASEYSFHETDVSPLVKNAFHALALDERRTPFTPTLWYLKDGNNVTNLKQVWFPGVHTNIGGGYPDQELADMTLAWMIECTGRRSTLEHRLEYEVGYLHSIIKNVDDGYSTEWAAGKIENSATGIMRLSAGSPRTPGGYELGVTNEEVHLSVRIRMRVVDGWKSNALKGWEWDETKKLWIKGDKVLKEAKLGEVEEVLAGKNIVERLLAKAKIQCDHDHDDDDYDDDL